MSTAHQSHETPEAKATREAAEAKAKVDAEKAAKAQAAADKKAADKKAADEKKAAEKAAKEQAAAKKKEDDAAAKKAAEEAKAAKKQPNKNGITRPAPETACGKVWGLADTMSKELGQPVPISHLLPKAQAAGLNDATTRTQYARWKQFFGVTGPVPKPAAVEAAATAPATQAAA